VSAWLSLVRERREDPCGELGGTTPIYELEQRAQVISAVARERLREPIGAASFAKTADSPREDALRISRSIWLSLDRRHAQ
jgi:hypothetical protein